MANQTSGKDGKGREMRCSFCGRSQNEVEQLLIGPGVNICNECIDMCHNMLYKDGENPPPPRAGASRRQQAQPGAAQSRYDTDPLASVNILTPAEIKAGLDQYVIGQGRCQACAGSLRVQTTTSASSPASRPAWSCKNLTC